MYLLKKFRNSQTRFSRKARKISLQSKKKIQSGGVVGVVLMREEKAFSEERKKIYKSHQIVLL